MDNKQKDTVGKSVTYSAKHSDQKHTFTIMHAHPNSAVYVIDHKDGSEESRRMDIIDARLKAQKLMYLGFTYDTVYFCECCHQEISEKEYNDGLCDFCEGDPHIWMDPAGGVHNDNTGYFSEE